MTQDSKASQERVRQALNSDNPDQKRIAEEGIRWLATLLDKNQDYGSSAWSPPICKPSLNAGDGIMVRMSDKVARIAQLSSGKSPAVAESLSDTIMDLGCYCLLWIARPAEETHSPEL